MGEFTCIDEVTPILQSSFMRVVGPRHEVFYVKEWHDNQFDSGSMSSNTGKGVGIQENEFKYRNRSYNTGK